MEISTAITSSVHALLRDLDVDGRHLHDPLADLGDHLAAAVDSFVGLELTLHAHQQPFSLCSWAPGPQVPVAAAAASLHLPVSALLTDRHTGGFTFWAATPGAFVDLAADLTYALALAPGTLELDEDLHQRCTEDGLFGLAAAAALNQAIGALIAAGHPPEAARRHLEEAAGVNGVSSEEQAHRLLAELR